VVTLFADDHLMGDEFSTRDAPRFRGHVAGTAPIERIELRRGVQPIWAFDALRSDPPQWSDGIVHCRLSVVWSGANSKNRNKVTQWDGGPSIEGGRIAQVEPFDLRHPAEGILDWNEHEVRWRSRTSGDADGVTLDLELEPGALLHFDTAPLRQTFRLREIGDEPLVVPAGKVDQQVELRWVGSEPGPLDVEWSHVDEGAPIGEHAYWVWITQADGECAWSSPIFISRHSP
jgi:hypothetical protein